MTETPGSPPPSLPDTVPPRDALANCAPAWDANAIRMSRMLTIRCALISPSFLDGLEGRAARPHPARLDKVLLEEISARQVAKRARAEAEESIQGKMRPCHGRPSLGCRPPPRRLRPPL